MKEIEIIIIFLFVFLHISLSFGIKYLCKKYINKKAKIKRND